MSRYDPEVIKLPNGKWLLQPLENYGPAMRRLTPKQRAFCEQYMALGLGIRGNIGRAVVLAGFADPDPSHYGRRLLQNQVIQDALTELGKANLTSNGPVAAEVLTEIMTDVTTSKRDRLRAAEMVLNRAGLHAVSEHKVDVSDKRDQGELMKRIKLLCEQLGADPKKLLGASFASKLEAVDAEYEVVPEVDDETEALFNE